jgi:hypothetical protein
MSVGGGSRPLYARVLRLRYLRLRPLAAFLLFEGSVAFAILLVLADLIDGWGVVAIPAAVAVMVKINDVVAGALNRPPDGLHVWSRRHRDRTPVGRSRVPYASRPPRADIGPGGGGNGRPGDGRPGGECPTGEGRPDEGGPGGVSGTQTRPRGADRDAPDGREPRTWAIARVVARGRATVRSARSAASEAVRPDGAGRRNRGNTGRFGG